MGERNEYIHCLAEDLVSLVLWHELNGAAVVKTVCELDQNHAYVIVQGKKDTLEVLCLHALLFCLVLVVEYCLDLGKTLNKGCNLVTEEAAKVVNCVICVFHHVVEKGGNN